MHPIETIQKGKDHAIEFGISSWDNEVESIRRRKNNDSGGFDPISSSEIPINSYFLDIGDLLCECLKRDKLSIKQINPIIKEIIKTYMRQYYARMKSLLIKS